MHKLKYILFSFLLLTLLPLSVKADCQSDFKAIEKKFTVSYQYNKDTDDFTITLECPQPQKYGCSLDKTMNAEMLGNVDEVTIKIRNYKKETYTNIVIGLTGTCQGKLLKEQEIKLNKYNQYADDPACKGNEDFVLCKKEYDKQIDRETFESRLETYKKSQESNNTDNTIDNKNSNKDNKDKQKENDTENKSNIFKNIINYIKGNLFNVIIITIFVIVLIITIIMSIISARKSWRLE